MCKQLVNIQFDYSMIAGSLCPSCSKLVKNVPYFRVSVGCLEGVWEVCGRCLGDFRHCLGGNGVDSFDKNPIWIIVISFVIFSLWPFLSN